MASQRHLIDLGPQGLPNKQQVTDSLAYGIPIPTSAPAPAALRPLEEVFAPWAKAIEETGPKVAERMYGSSKAAMRKAAQPALDMMGNQEGLDWMNQEFLKNNPLFEKMRAAGLFK